MTLFQNPVFRVLGGAAVAFSGVTLIAVIFSLSTSSGDPWKRARAVPFTVQSWDLVLSGDPLQVDGSPVERGDLTIECWARVASGVPATQVLLGAGRGKGLGLALSYERSGAMRPIAWVSIAGGGMVEAEADWTTQQQPGWHHYAMTHSARGLSIFVDGRLRAFERTNGVRDIAPATLGIGGILGPGGTVFLPARGIIDDVRISRVVRYETTFQPPVHHQVDADTTLLLDFEDAHDSGWRDQSPGNRPVGPFGKPPHTTRGYRRFQPR